MSKNQKIVVFSTGVILLFMIIFPPFNVVRNGQIVRDYGYHFVITPPNKGRYVRINSERLLIQCLAIAGIGALCWFALKKPDSSASSEHPSPERTVKKVREDTSSNNAKKIALYILWVAVSLPSLAILRSIAQGMSPEYSILIMGGAFALVAYAFFKIKNL